MAKKRLQKVFALILALSLATSLVSVTAFAEESEETTTEPKTESTSTETTDSADPAEEDDAEDVKIVDDVEDVNDVDSAEDAEDDADEGIALLAEDEVVAVEDIVTVTGDVYNTNYVFRPSESSNGMLLAQSGASFTDCTFDLTAKGLKTVQNGEYYGCLYTAGNNTFTNCTFIVGPAERTNGKGTDATLNLHGSVLFKKCKFTLDSATSQAVGIYGAAEVSFRDSTLESTNSIGWVFAAYGGSMLTFDNSIITVSGTQRPSGSNTSVLYAEGASNLKIINDSQVSFKDNNSGAFALNNGYCEINASTVSVTGNKGNGSNSGYWTIQNGSTVNFSNNSVHGLSCNAASVADSSLTVCNNGYAGVYIQSGTLTAKNSTLDISCNGKIGDSYNDGDLWLHSGKDATFTNSKVWLGAIGKKGNVIDDGCTEFVAFALNNNDTNQITISSNSTDGTVKHSLYDYHFSDADKADAPLTDITNETEIASYTEVALSHHVYDWNMNSTAATKPIVVKEASTDSKGIIQYTCTECGHHVYGPSVSLSFNANTQDTVSSLPEIQQVPYSAAATQPSVNPSRNGYSFGGWYTDAGCASAYDFASILTDNMTVFAKWTANTTPGGGDDGNGGDTTPSNPIPSTPSTDIPDDDTPLVDLPEDDTPLIDAPVDEDIPDEAAPLAEAPKTGDNQSVILSGACALASLAGLLYLTLSGKKKENKI